ncbi:hypothetical protein E2C01_093006 [Portunus trituberculatus]|uniref:Helix-turn-helix domain-containing protein n=1 Tax=Portunus trituberculatus TaxID=210409 RepID=A0A5B7JHY4_PORTR|nr:hypothetical protein [Portunus trituberculatus]
MPFLDVLVQQEDEKLTTSIYTKPTNPRFCLNGRSECSAKYKDATISVYIRRALTHCSMWKLVHQEIECFTQVLINNRFSEKDVSHLTKMFIGSWYNKKQREKKEEDISIFL